MDMNEQALTPNRISSSLLYEWFTTRRHACAWLGDRWTHVDAGSSGEMASHLGKGYPRIGVVCRSNARGSAVRSRNDTSGSHASSPTVAGRAGNLTRSLCPSPQVVTPPGHVKVSTLERFKNVHEVSFTGGSPRWGGRESGCAFPPGVFHGAVLRGGLLRHLSRARSAIVAEPWRMDWPPMLADGPGTVPVGVTGRAAPTSVAGHDGFAGPASAWNIGLGLNGSARRRGTDRLCTTTAFAGQFPRSAMVSTKTTREEEEREF